MKSVICVIFNPHSHNVRFLKVMLVRLAIFLLPRKLIIAITHLASGCLDLSAVIIYSPCSRLVSEQKACFWLTEQELEFSIFTCVYVLYRVDMQYISADVQYMHFKEKAWETGMSENGFPDNCTNPLNHQDTTFHRKGLCSQGLFLCCFSKAKFLDIPSLTH